MLDNACCMVYEQSSMSANNSIAFIRQLNDLCMHLLLTCFGVFKAVILTLKL